jgi:hypothetical protein
MPNTRKGTYIGSTAWRQPWLEEVCRRQGLDPTIHRDRVQAYEHAMRREAEREVTGTEPLAGAITMILRGAAMAVACGFKRSRGHPRWQRMIEEGRAGYVDALQAKK